MALFRRRQPLTATLGGRPLVCLVCAGPRFWTERVTLRTTGLELLGLGWASRSSTALVCAACGYVRQFVGDRVTLWRHD